MKLSWSKPEKLLKLVKLKQEKPCLFSILTPSLLCMNTNYAPICTVTQLTPI